MKSNPDFCKSPASRGFYKNIMFVCSQFAARAQSVFLYLVHVENRSFRHGQKEKPEAGLCPAPSPRITGLILEAVYQQ